MPKCSQPDCDVDVKSDGEMCPKHTPPPAPPPPMNLGGQPAEAEEVVVPSVIEKSEEEAGKTLRVLKLEPQVVNRTYSLTQTSKVVWQSPSGDSPASKKQVKIDVVSKSEQGDGVKEKNKSSSVPKVQMDEFVQALVKNADLGFPVFSVSDCNSFHTTGYLWGLYAAKTVKSLGLPVGPVAVVNFDQHDDAGERGGTFVASDRWGRQLVTALGDLGFRACYLTIMNGKEAGSAALYTVDGLKKVRGEVTAAAQFFAKPPSRDKDQADREFVKRIVNRVTLGEYWSDVREKYFGGDAVKYVFVTIDRDCLESSFTQWGDGGVADVSSLKNVMDAVLNPLLSPSDPRVVLRRGNSNEKDTGPGGMLIGFDVTGLPEHESLLGAHQPRLLKANLTKGQPRAGENLSDFAERVGAKGDRIEMLNPGKVPWKLKTEQPKKGEKFGDFATRVELSEQQIKEMNVKEIPNYNDFPWNADAPPRLVLEELPEFVIGHKKDFAGMCKDVWEQVRLGNLFDFAERWAVPSGRNWSKILFFSGSVGFGSGNTDYGDGGESKKSDCWDFLANLSRRLPGLLKDDWHYVLCTRRPPIYKQGWKPFSVFIPKNEVANCKDGEAAREALGKPVADPAGGFSCSASLSDPGGAAGLGWGKEVDVHSMLSKQGDFFDGVVESVDTLYTFDEVEGLRPIED